LHIIHVKVFANNSGEAGPVEPQWDRFDRVLLASSLDAEGKVAERWGGQKNGNYLIFLPRHISA
jgi:hypothetical protein